MTSTLLYICLAALTFGLGFLAGESQRSIVSMLQSWKKKEAEGMRWRDGGLVNIPAHPRVHCSILQSDPTKLWPDPMDLWPGTIRELPSGMRREFESRASRAWRDVLMERRRQVEVKGFDAAHDDQHGRHPLAKAAACYAVRAGGLHSPWLPALWPWAKEWWRPGTERQNAVKAAALLLAFIEHIDRQSAGDPQ